MFRPRASLYRQSDWCCRNSNRLPRGAARGSGNQRLAKTIRGGGNLIGGLLPIGYEEEQTIGQAIALQVIARYGGVYDQPDLTRYVNLVGRAVALTCDRADIEYRFAILNHDSINAFAAPAGYIFVTRGLLKTVRNEAELATVLGHEIGHVTAEAHPRRHPAVQTDRRRGGNRPGLCETRIRTRSKT